MSFGRIPVSKPEDAACRVRVPCPRCAVVNCTDHSALALASRVVTAPHLRSFTGAAS